MESYSGTAGGGARLNGQPISVSPITEPVRALIGTGFPFKDGTHVDEYLRTLPRIMQETTGIRRPGAAALDLAAVACGRFEAFWELSSPRGILPPGCYLSARPAASRLISRVGRALSITRRSWLETQRFTLGYSSELVSHRCDSNKP